MNKLIPTLHSSRLRLTALTEQHFEAYAAMLGDPQSTRFIGDGQALDRVNAWRSMAMLLGHWVLRGYGMWALERLDNGAFVGRAGLLKPEGWPDVELGWMIAPETRNQGYASEAATAVLDFAWQTLELNRVVSLIRPGDAASEHLARRLHGEQVNTIDLCGRRVRVYAYHPPPR